MEDLKEEIKITRTVTESDKIEGFKRISNIIYLGWKITNIEVEPNKHYVFELIKVRKKSDQQPKNVTDVPLVPNVIKF